MLNIFDWWRGRTGVGRTATDIYGSIVAKARDPLFYTAFKVADVAEKRYELIVLHLLVVLERLRADGEASKELSQALIEAFVRDLDGSMRELAVGDMSVPRKVKKAAGGLFDRDLLFREAFASAGEGNSTTGLTTGAESPKEVPLSRQALIQELLFGDGPATRTAALVLYVEAAREATAAWQPTQTTTVPFPDLNAFVRGNG